MSRPRLPQSIGAIGAVLFVLAAFALAGGQRAFAQQPSEEEKLKKGIELYQIGDYPNAIKLLKEAVKKHSDNADAWYYLGLALFRNGMIGESRQRFERAVKLRPDLADAHAKLAFVYTLANDLEVALQSAKSAIELDDKFAEPHYAIAEISFRNGAASLAVQEADLALQVDPQFGPALMTKSFAHSSLKQYAEAIAPLERFIALSPNDPDNHVWRDQLSWLKDLTKESSDSSSAKPTSNQSKPISGKEATVKARVFSKAAPGYTETARLAGQAGSVVLRCIFSSDGTVKNIYVVRPLGYGLTGRAIIAARSIRFEPAIKDGHPVSQYMQLEYPFSLY
jgi:TonB family protein